MNVLWLASVMDGSLPFCCLSLVFLPLVSLFAPLYLLPLLSPLIFSSLLEEDRLLMGVSKVTAPLQHLPYITKTLCPKVWIPWGQTACRPFSITACTDKRLRPRLNKSLSRLQPRAEAEASSAAVARLPACCPGTNTPQMGRPKAVKKTQGARQTLTSPLKLLGFSLSRVWLKETSVFANPSPSRTSCWYPALCYGNIMMTKDLREQKPNWSQTLSARFIRAELDLCIGRKELWA